MRSLVIVVLIYGLGKGAGEIIWIPQAYIRHAAHEGDLMFQGNLYMRPEEVIIIWLWYVETNVIMGLLSFAGSSCESKADLKHVILQAPLLEYWNYIIMCGYTRSIYKWSDDVDGRIIRVKHCSQ